VLLGSRHAIPDADLAPKAAALRRRLFVPVVIVLLLAFLVSLGWVPYPAVRAAILGQRQISVTADGQQWPWTLSQNRLPAHVPIEFVVTAQDVNHDFAIYDAQGGSWHRSRPCRATPTA
jgi:heme/copper-type cytochrome/quinol oxidase subunit 2